jgi:hypothetical protein
VKGVYSLTPRAHSSLAGSSFDLFWKYKKQHKVLNPKSDIFCPKFFECISFKIKFARLKMIKLYLNNYLRSIF